MSSKRGGDGAAAAAAGSSSTASSSAFVRGRGATTTTSASATPNARPAARPTQPHRDTIEIDLDEDDGPPAAPPTKAKTHAAPPRGQTPQARPATFAAATSSAAVATPAVPSPVAAPSAAAASALSFIAAGESTAAAAASRSSLLASFAPLLLPFHLDIIRQLTHQDGLVILGRGLGIQHIWAGFIAQYLQALPTVQAATPFTSGPDASSTAALPPSALPPSSASPHLVFLLNFDDDLLQWLNETYQTAHFQPHSSGDATDSQRWRTRGIRQINNEYNVAERQQLYLQGGVLSITSRILTVDLLNSVISCDLISGFCVHSAHSVSDVSPETFILRIWRKANKTGWIKAMSDEAGAFTRGGGRGSARAFGGLEVVMKSLFLRKVWLYPRFTISVNESLNPPEEVDVDVGGPGRFSLAVEELHQPFSELMTSIQNSLVEVIDTLITQLKSENKHLTIYDHPTHAAGSGVNPSDAATSRTFQTLNLSIEAGLMKNFESLLKAELNPIQHKLSSKTKSILSDLTALRSCIAYLINYDCITFYRYLLLIKSNAVGNTAGASTWLLSESADKLFKVAKQRVYTFQQGLSPQAAASLTAKREKQALKLKQQAAAKSASARGGGSGGGSKHDAMELSDDDDEASRAASSARVSTEDSIQLVLEENPKWSLLVDTLEEIEAQICERTKEYQQQTAEAEAADIMRGPSRSGQVKDEVPNTAPTPLRLPPSFGRTLLLVRDARTATFLTRLLTVGGRNLLKNYWKKYLFSLKLHKRQFSTPAPTSAFGHAKASPVPAASSTAGSSTFHQFQRESVLLKRELDGMLDMEQLDRFLDQQAYAAELKTNASAQKEQQEADENSGFDLVDEKQTTLTGKPAVTKRAAKKPPAAAAANASPLKPAQFTAPNMFKPGQRDHNIEALEREIDEDHPTAGPPQLQFDPRTKPSASGATKGKRPAKPAATDAAGASRKKPKTGSSSQEAEAVTDSSLEEEMRDVDAPPKHGADDADVDLLFDDQRDEQDDQPARTFSLAQQASAMGRPSGTPSTASSFLFDRSDFSVIDSEFKMSSVQPPVVQNATSPFFPHGTGASAEAPPVAHLSSSTTVTVLPAYQLLIHPLSGLHSILHRYRPEYVLIFDPDILCIRELEVFQALPTTNWQLRVYFMLYANSIEQQRYVTSIEQENKAFEHLIQTKKNMVVPIEQDGRLPEPQTHPQSADDRKQASLYEDGVRNSTYEAYAATLPNAVDTRRGGGLIDAPGTILVDVREFRSSLPSLLHAANLIVQPITLEIADYVLTPTLAIERKSVPDLIGSLASGRLYKQMEQAIRFYKTPVLLIEFDRSRPFLLLSKSDLAAEISAKSVLSKLALLILHFPQMRILWSRDSHATTSLFLALKQKQLQPTIEQAATANSHAAKTGEFASGLSGDDDRDEQLSLTPHDILRKLPGVNATNLRILLQHVGSLRELCDCTSADLTKWIGATSAKKLHAFLHDEP